MNRDSYRSWRVALLVVGALALAPGACKKSGPEGGGAGATGEAGALEGAAAAFPQSTPALTGVEALKFFPKDALAVGVVGDLVKLLDGLGRAKLIEKFRAPYEKAVAAVTAATGQNLMDPATWKEIGVDAHAPVGGVWLSLEKETGALFFGLTDPEKFKTFVYATAGRFGGRFETETAGDALIIFPKHDEEICLVLRGKQAIVVMADHDKDGIAAARQVAAVAEADSLAKREDFTAAVAKLGYGTDAAFWVDLPTLSAMVTKEIAASHEESSPYTQMIASAKESGADAAEIARLVQLREENEAWETRWQKQRQAQRELLGAFSKPFGSLAVGVQLGDAAVTAKMVSTVEDGSLPARLTLPMKGGFPVVRALDDAPLYLMAARTDLAAWRSFVAQLVATEGDDLAEGEAELKKMTGIDVEADVLAALDGVFGVAVTGAFPTKMENEQELIAGLGGALTIGVTDEAKGKGLLEKIRQIPPVMAIVQVDPKTGDWSIAVPGWKTVTIALRGNAIIAATDRPLLERIGKNETGAWLKDKASPELKRLLSLGAPSVVYAIDMSASAFWFIGMRGMEYSDVAAAPDDGGAPESAAYVAKKKEREALEEQLGALRKQQTEAETGGILKVMEMLGTTAFVATRDGGTFTVYGGQYLAAKDLATFAAEAADAAVLQMTVVNDLRRKTWELEEKRWQLRREIDQMREDEARTRLEQQEAERAKALQPIPSPAPPSDAP